MALMVPSSECQGDKNNARSGILLNSAVITSSYPAMSPSASPPPSDEDRRHKNGASVRYPNAAEMKCKRLQLHSGSNSFRELSVASDSLESVCPSDRSKDMGGNHLNFTSSSELVMANRFKRVTNSSVSTSSLSSLSSRQSSPQKNSSHHHLVKKNKLPPKPSEDATAKPESAAIKLAADCLHAQDYARIITTLAGELDSIAVHFGRGLGYYKMRKFHEAMECLQEMSTLASADFEQHPNVYLANYYLGEIHVALSQHRKAAHYYQKASKAYSTNTVARQYRIVQPSQATVLSKLGSALRHSQQILESVKAYNDALRVVETDKDKLAIRTSLGNLYQSLGENASALEQYEETIKLAKKLGDYISLGWGHGNIGNAYLGLYQKDKALSHLEMALDLTVEHEPSPQAIGRAYNNLGTAYQSLNELKKAEEYYDLALSQAIYGADLGGQARVYGNCGNLLMIQKKYDPAISHYSEALAITTDRSTRSTAHHNRGCAHYEKAESTKKRLVQGTKAAVAVGESGFHVTYGGPTVEDQPHDPPLIDSVRSDYAHGRDDLMEVVSFHEETFQTIKGSSHGLSLSVSLFETNSRTFHRLQDCFFNLGEWSQALECAEQSRARTLGELMLQRKSGQLEMELTSPLKIDQVESIIASADTTVVFVSYTGARLLTWVFTPCREEGGIVTNRFQVSLEDDQFDGKSLDYFLRYSLSEKLIEDSVEMYSFCTYKDSPPLSKLFEVFGRPLLTILDRLGGCGADKTTLRDVVLVPDSYTNLVPLVALLDAGSQRFLGDRFRFRIMPSLLTLGVLSQLPQVTVKVPEESSEFCIVGNPAIPTFRYQGETWNLGKLPHATQEAEGVAHILKCTPTLHEQATKMVVLSMISSAKVIHLATHGSASAGFLAFAGLGSSRSGTVSDEKLVLLYPDDVEKLAISPALVVLSSCDSGRGMMKADGIQGMARAFFLAGAQAVLTTLWRVPDESAAVFMQFFYKYMMEGFKGSHALQKAVMSIRSFKKYSRYIHWSGYQLTGREIQFQVRETGDTALMRKRMGPTTVFPRMEPLKALEKSFIKDPYLPTDVQIVVGVHGLKPREIIIEFVSDHHQHFTGGVFYVSAKNEHFMIGAEQMIKKEITETSDSPTLLIIEDLLTLPPESSYLHTLLARNSTHIVLILHDNLHLDVLRKQIDTQLMRGANVMELKPLSELHCTQRLVHGIVSRAEFTPYTKEQNLIADVAEKVIGSPDLVDVASAVLAECIDKECEDSSFLETFHHRVCCNGEANLAVSLVRDFDLSKSDFFLLSTLSLFGNAPVPRPLVETLQVLAIAASPEVSHQLSPLSHLTTTRLLSVYPSVIVSAPHSSHTSLHRDSNTECSSTLAESDFYSVPQIIADAVRSCMDEQDTLFSVAAAHRALCKFYSECVQESVGQELVPFMAGLARMLANFVEQQEELEECYKDVYRTYVLYAMS